MNTEIPLVSIELWMVDQLWIWRVQLMTDNCTQMLDEGKTDTYREATTRARRAYDAAMLYIFTP